MPLDAKGRTKRAKKAAKVAVKNRQAKVKERDICIYLAYRYLSDMPLEMRQYQKMFEFLIKTSGNANLRPQQTVLRKLADCTGLTRQRIHQIIKKAEKQT